VRISFPDAGTQQVFNDYARLEAQYGPSLAVKIATRLAVLAAARHLGLVPRRPPIRLRACDDRAGHFTVDLTVPRRLRFCPSNLSVGGDRRLDARLVEEIDVVGVD
jgi:hypothetical protein